MLLRVDMLTLTSKGSARMKPALSKVALVVAFVAPTACGQTKAAPTPETTVVAAPFIKLARRQIAVILHADRSLSPAEQDVLLRTLKDQLGVAYKTKVVAARRSGVFERIAPRQLADFALQGIDDAVVLELRSASRVRGMRTVRVRVINLNRLRATVDLALPTSGATGRRLASLVVQRLTTRWSDPGAEPEMDPLAAANRLADNRSCRAALRIYRQVLPRRRPTTVVDVAGYQAAEVRFDRCVAEEKMQTLLAADAQAQFSLRIEAKPMAPRIVGALQDALRESSLTETVRRWTDKPAVVRAEPQILYLELRFHPEHYRAATARRPKYERGHPVLYLDPFVELFEGLLDLRDAAIEKLPPYDRANLEPLQTQLYLSRLPDDYVVITFSDGSGRLLISDGLDVKVGRRPEVRVNSLRSGVSRSLRLILGPPQDATGALTDYGLVFRFFGLE